VHEEEEADGVGERGRRRAVNRQGSGQVSISEAISGVVQHATAISYAIPAAALPGSEACPPDPCKLALCEAE
jgi:hypothetical protein